MNPLSIIELKAGETRMALIMESPEQVKEIINDPDAPRLVTFTRWTVGGTHELITRPDNVLTVRPNA